MRWREGDREVERGRQRGGERETERDIHTHRKRKKNDKKLNNAFTLNSINQHAGEIQYTVSVLLSS